MSTIIKNIKHTIGFIFIIALSSTVFADKLMKLQLYTGAIGGTPVVMEPNSYAETPYLNPDWSVIPWKIVNQHQGTLHLKLP